MINLTSGWTKSGPFFQNQGIFLNSQKRVGLASPSAPPSYTPDVKDFYSRIMEQYFSSQNSICNCKSAAVTTYAMIHMRMALKCLNALRFKVHYVAKLKNPVLRLKWHKFIKIIQVLLRFKYNFHWLSKPN